MQANECGRFDATVFNELCVQRGLDTDAKRARALGVAQSTICRVKKGERQPGLRLAHACRRLFGSTEYDRLFQDGDA